MPLSHPLPSTARNSHLSGVFNRHPYPRSSFSKNAHEHAPNTTTRRIAFETGMTEDEVKEHLNVLEQQDGKVALDDGSCGGGLSILVVNFIKHQCTTSPKLVMSLRALFRGVESEKIRAVLIAKNPHLLDGMDTVSGTLSIRSGEIDQDQIQENKKREEIRSFL